mmetsp:Transcript_18359/g.27483  ORF Transcript_18359/g.27483 Transcript_18359/m.27483 type:complete len:96 (+) Transcript_18359:571-858(+)
MNLKKLTKKCTKEDDDRWMKTCEETLRKHMMKILRIWNLKNWRKTKNLSIWIFENVTHSYSTYIMNLPLYVANVTYNVFGTIILVGLCNEYSTFC